MAADTPITSPQGAITTLIEREGACALLLAAVERAANGEGACVLVGGEAGVGKTSVMAWLDAEVRHKARVLWGACEALTTPRPLGPLNDMAHELGAPLQKALSAGEAPAIVFDTLIESLRSTGSLTVLLFEDVHWADHATLDLIRFLGRRVQRQKVVFILTYRDDEVGADHPLRAAIGDLPMVSTRRIELAPLSEDGVRLLSAQHDVDKVALHALTGGNPLFVSEVLAGLEVGNPRRVPPTVRDAVLARTQRLPKAPRAVLDLASVVPGKVERVLLLEILGTDAETAIATCVLRNLLVEVDGGGALIFRHELVRLAVETTLSPSDRRALHRRWIDAQITRPTTSSARLVHHALALNEPSLVLEVAQRAAHEAASLGSHREAAAHLATALGVAQNAPDAVRAQLYESWSYETGLVKVDDATIDARHHAIALWRKLGNFEKVGLNLRCLSRLIWFRGDGAQAERFLDEAIHVLENIPPCAEQAWACGVRSQMFMLNDATAEALEWGERALQLAETLNVPEVRVHALNSIGTALLDVGNTEGLAKLDESLQLALAGGFHEQAARVYTNATSASVRYRQLATAEKYAIEGIAFDRAHDLDSWRFYLEGVVGQLRLHQGRFEDAEAIARKALDNPSLTALMRLPALGVLGHIRIRQGHADGNAYLNQGLALALPMRELARVVPFAVALAESAWLSGDVAGVRHAISILDKLPGANTNPWDRGASVIWLHRIGDNVANLADQLAAPFSAEIRGDIDAAVKQWHEVGDPYSAALALAHSNGAKTHTHWLTAIDLFTKLGALPAATLLRDRARVAGVQGLRRGVYGSAKANEFGLTAKELDVLRLLAAGKSNAAIAIELVRSSKTIEHHVSSILAKLGVNNRTEAAAAAAREGLLVDGGSA